LDGAGTADVCQRCTHQTACQTEDDSKTCVFKLRFCTACKAGSALDPDTTGICLGCSLQDGCLIPDPTVACIATEFFCTSCLPGYWKSPAGVCTLCIDVPNCMDGVGVVTCTSGTDQVCSACDAGYYGGVAFPTPTCTTCGSDIPDCVDRRCIAGVQKCYQCDSGFSTASTPAAIIEWNTAGTTDMCTMCTLSCLPVSQQYVNPPCDGFGIQPSCSSCISQARCDGADGAGPCVGPLGNLVPCDGPCVDGYFLTAAGLCTACTVQTKCADGKSDDNHCTVASASPDFQFCTQCKPPSLPKNPVDGLCI